MVMVVVAAGRPEAAVSQAEVRSTTSGSDVVDGYGGAWRKPRRSASDGRCAVSGCTMVRDGVRGARRGHGCGLPPSATTPCTPGSPILDDNSADPFSSLASLSATAVGRP
ncbi:hypothetical protein E2562_022779 [Oryza meyeriana var. granulata]|uniref:Uncharacterized protein n=1 Tax=Oryza meyeriana var. granulata TaxID=110450 RepID=A0A6G1FB09_9ORYZ|nr:hypothetical protein E2562_022779 [Oryza meyeriana var. granulata]